MKKEKKKRLTPEQLDANYFHLMKNKQLNEDGKELFAKAIKKAVTPKQRSLK